MNYTVSFHSGCYEEENCTLPSNFDVHVKGYQLRPETTLRLKPMQFALNSLGLLTQLRTFPNKETQAFDFYCSATVECESEEAAREIVLAYFPDASINFAISEAKAQARKDKLDTFFRGNKVLPAETETAAQAEFEQKARQFVFDVAPNVNRPVTPPAETPQKRAAKNAVYARSTTRSSS